MLKASKSGGKPLLLLLLASCGGGGGGGGMTAPTTYSVGGSVTGLSAAGLSLANGSDSVAVGAGQSSFTFPTQLTTGKTYSVTIKTQPSGELCYVTNGSGTVAAINVSNVAVTCGAHNFWLVVSGSDIALNGTGSGGVRGVAAATNLPASRQDGGTWADGSGNLWLFGGGTDAFPNSTTDELNDLWRYSIATGEWTWISGADKADGTAVYGTKGVAGAANSPGVRSQPDTWTDLSGNLWMFGGDEGGSPMDELWMFSPSSGEWTWVGGSQAANVAPTYGTKGVASPANDPGWRMASVTWTDASGNLWLFGGAGGAAVNTLLADLWMYSPSSAQWIWVSGSSTPNDPGVYGTQGVAAAGNYPPARWSAVGRVDASGNLWLFGGAGTYNFETVTDAALNDLWEFSPTTGLWTWQAGTQGVLNPTPPSEPYQILPVPLWIDANNAVWQYGSATEEPTIGVAYETGFSRFDPATGQWSNLSSPALQPAGRTNAMTWIDAQGRFWMFGGSMSGNFVDGFAGGAYGGLWEYLP